MPGFPILFQGHFSNILSNVKKWDRKKGVRENLQSDSWASEEEEEVEEERGELNSLEKLVYWLCLGASILKVYVYNKSLIKIRN